jgi:hypothetical protein
LPWLAWKGIWAAVLIAVIVAEIVLTLWDFVVEIDVRRELGDVYAGERVTHAAMGILYGAMLALLIPTILIWWRSSTGVGFSPSPLSGGVRVALTVMGIGVFASGLRDLYAALELQGGGWPWETPQRGER